LGCSFWVDFLQVCKFDSFSAYDELSLVWESEYFGIVAVDIYDDCGLWEPIHSCISDCDNHLCPPVLRQSAHVSEPMPWVYDVRFGERAGVYLRVWAVLV